MVGFDFPGDLEILSPSHFLSRGSYAEPFSKGGVFFCISCQVALIWKAFLERRLVHFIKQHLYKAIEPMQHYGNNPEKCVASTV